MSVHWHSRLARSIALAIVVALAIPGATLGQAAPLSAPPPASMSVPVLFAVSPTEPTDRTLTVLIDKHDCGSRLRQVPEGISVEEAADVVAIRVEVRPTDDGQTCPREDLLRLEVKLEAPLGDRVITDAARGVPALVNRVDAMDMGYEYDCDFGRGPGFSVTELLGPGHDVSAQNIPTSLEGARAMIDQGDYVVLRGPFGRRGSVVIETWRLKGDDWKRRRSRCRLMATSPPSLNTASWKLKGRSVDPGSKSLDILVQEWACASGYPPVGRVVPPDVRFHEDSVVIVAQTFPMSRTWEANERNRGADAASTAGYTYVDCQGAPPAPYKVKLLYRLGDRALYDGGVFPPKEIKSKRR